MYLHGLDPQLSLYRFLRAAHLFQEWKGSESGTRSGSSGSNFYTFTIVNANLNRKKCIFSLHVLQTCIIVYSISQDCSKQRFWAVWNYACLTVAMSFSHGHQSSSANRPVPVVGGANPLNLLWNPLFFVRSREQLQINWWCSTWQM